MNSRLFILPTLCLGGAALLLAPARPSQAFSKLSGSLGETQRDVRVFDNFADVGADDNVTPASQFPGWTGLELAMWKAVIEWGSRLHGDGTGDSVGGNTLGSGGANFDAMWSGNATAVGNSNHNVVSALSSCGGGGTLAFMDGPITSGWRIRFCDEWAWSDGPGTIPNNNFDLQGVMAHEYGHALGLGHSASGSATMAPSVSAGNEGPRSIFSDDIAGIQCIYGVASVTKPIIDATVADTGAGTLTIYGSEFGGASNEVWFTNSAATATSTDPIVRVTGVNSSVGGTVITVLIPAGASPGDVMVNKTGTGGATLSNAFPTDLVGIFGDPPIPSPSLTDIDPSSIDALIPGTDETIVISGFNLDSVTSVKLDGVNIPSSRWTIVNSTTITLDMPQASSLGPHDLGVSNGVVTEEISITVFSPPAPRLEWGNGDPGNIVDQDLGLTMTLAGTVGSQHLVLSSNSGVPTLGRFFGFESLSFEGALLQDPGAYTIPAQGWLTVTIPNLPDPAQAGANWFAQSYEVVFPQPFADSNDQTITLVP